MSANQSQPPAAGEAAHTPTPWKVKIGIPATVNRANLPTLVARELSDYHAFNPARIVGRQCDRVCLQWQDGHRAWFDQEAIIPLFQ